MQHKQQTQQLNQNADVNQKRNKIGRKPYFYKYYMNIGFDLISDLNLTVDSEFDWEGKATSLFCVIPGNISNDMGVVYKTLKQLSVYYQGVFYIDGSLENKDLENRDSHVNELQKICSMFKNVVFLHNNVVVLDGIAILGINGWYGNYKVDNDDDRFQMKCYRYEDLVYLEKTIERLQLHVDVKRTVVVSNSVPTAELYYGEAPDLHDTVPLNYCTSKDTEHKIQKWVFGSYGKIVDTKINSINYLNNPPNDLKYYYPKRFEIEI